MRKVCSDSHHHHSQVCLFSLMQKSIMYVISQSHNLMGADCEDSLMSYSAFQINSEVELVLTSYSYWPFDLLLTGLLICSSLSCECFFSAICSFMKAYVSCLHITHIFTSLSFVLTFLEVCSDTSLFSLPQSPVMMEGPLFSIFS